MKSFLISVLLFSISQTSFTQSLDTATSEDRRILFEPGLSWEQVKTKAKAENKYIFVDCYATWCGPCKLMDKEVYPNDTVATYINEKFIAVKLQLDSSKQDNENVKSWYATARKIGEEYEITGYPTFLFFTPDGKL